MKTVLLLVALGALLIGALWNIGPFFAEYGSEMSFGGWLALVLGTIVGVGLGAGLMTLVFVSARRGYDEAAQWEHEDDAAEKQEEPR